MGIFSHWDISNRIRKLENTPNRTPQQEDRLRKLYQAYSTGKTTYTPPITYPTQNTQARPEDTLYRTREEWRRANPSRGIGKVYDVDSLIHSPIILRMYPQQPGEFENEYRNRLRRIIEEHHKPQSLNTPLYHYNADPTKDFFKSRKLNPNQRSFVSLDIETDDYGHPISISALKFQYDKAKQEFVNVGNYQRFYQAHNWDLRATEAVHGLSASVLKGLRKQQGANYGKTYKGQEIDDLQTFLGSSVVVGHNIQNFDLDMLFPDRVISNSTIDTLAAARNAWKGSRNDLDNVFRRIFGKTMEQAGLSHHDANADTIASMMVLEALHKDPGRVGEAIRYVMGSRGQRQLVEYDEYLNSMVVKGTYKSTYRGKGGNRSLGEVYMTAEEMGLKKNGKMVEGFSEVDVSRMDPNRMSDEELLSSAAADLIRHAKAADDDYKMYSASQDAGSEAVQAMNTYMRYQEMNLVNRLASAKSQETADAILASAGYKLRGDAANSIMEMAARLKTAREKDELQKMLDDAEFGNWRSSARDLTSGEYVGYGEWGNVGKYTPWGDKESIYTGSHFDRNEALRKMRYLDKAERSGFLSKKERASLDNLVGSYDDLVDATENMIDANQRLLKVYEAIGKIKPYDINQYISSARNQWSGVMGASRGVLPSFIRNPISRLGDATFNVIDRSVAPWNAIQRTWNSGIGNALTGALTAGMGPVGLGIGMGITGAVNAGTQIFGNYKQAKMEMSMLNIQNNLNTLGAMISWISTPFQLLHKAAKLLIGSFSGLSYKLNSIMGGGIGLMSQMGNPLEQMTGVDYLKYQGTTLMDLASLQNKGATNSAIESFATMQRNLYRFGQVDTGKLLAANMLGVFNEAFSPTTDTVGSYYAMGNKILHNMMGQSEAQQADTLYYVNQLNSSLAQTIRSALMMGVTDLRQLTDPSAFHYMYWRPISDEEEGNFRKTQYEYGVATQQFGYTKMRFADTLWNAVGRDLYNGLNKLIDKAAMGDWKGVLDTAGEMWEKFKKKVSDVWTSIQGKGGLSIDLSKPLQKIKEWAWDGAIAIMDAWNAIFRLVLDKSQSLIAYLSTLQVGIAKDKKTGKWGIDITSIKDASIPGNKNIYHGTANSFTGEYTVDGVNSGMEGYAALVDALFPTMTDWEKQFLTRETLAERLRHLPGVIKDGKLDTPELNLEDYFIQGLNLGHNPELIEPLLDMLGAAESSGAGFRKQAAWETFGSKLKDYQAGGLYDTMGLMNLYDNLTADVMDAMLTARSISLGDSQDGKIVVEFKGLGETPITATRENGKWTLSGMNPLQSIKLGNGAAMASVQTQGG